MLDQVSKWLGGLLSPILVEGVEATVCLRFRDGLNG
jgi:hypothetical protein